MPSYAPITVHESQWPAALAAQLGESLRKGRINHKFHYDSPRQVRQWLRLHEAHSPARQASEFRTAYECAFESVMAQVGQHPIHLIGLGCGGGQKEAALLQRLVLADCPVTFSASDVSSGMVITALQAAWKHLRPTHCSGLVCDLVEATDLNGFLDSQTPADARRVVTFFGMIPNFEPDVLRALLRGILRPGDLLLSSANLAPGDDYLKGVEQVLPQYDNALTHEWLGMLLDDVGIDRTAGSMKFGIQESPEGSGLLRITATFEFHQPATARVEGEGFKFAPGTNLRLFFSCRHTLNTLETVLAPLSLASEGSWISESGEEGVFLAAAAGA